MEQLIISLLSGAAGGNIVGKVLKNLDLGPIGNSIAGILGGGLGSQILASLGSADAAAALRLATRLWNIDLDSTRPSDVAAELGADVPACIISQTCFGTGVGDQLHRIDGNELAGLPLLLVNPLIACPTGPVFQAWNGFDLGPLDPESWVAGRNDLELPAITLHPEIADVLACLREMQPRIARMSGSGATCFAIFESSSRRDAALRQISTACPDWWTMASSIR